MTQSQPQTVVGPDGTLPARIAKLRDAVARSGHIEAARLLRKEDGPTIAGVLGATHTALAIATLWELSQETRANALASAPDRLRQKWVRNHAYEPQTVGRLMDTPRAVFTTGQTVADVIDRMQALLRETLIIYGYVCDADGHLKGVLIFRELLFARPEQLVDEVMLADPFALRAREDIESAMKETVVRHFPEYPIVDDVGRLIGVLRGGTLFEQHAFELSAQAGRMVGVESNERLSTPWNRSLRFRHPWLQLNLLTAFAAAAVVGVFQETIDRVVLLAAFLPVLAGQSGNTGCQSLAVTLRGMTLGEFEGGGRRVAAKEMVLGVLNGALVGLTAGAGMYAYAFSQGNPAALRLGAVVFVAMVFSCVVSGVAGTIVPRMLRRFGADPATASSIFLTTATDVVSMGSLLALATYFVR